MRAPRRGLPQWLSETSQPLFVVDGRRVVIFFNEGCQKLTGWSAADVIGQTCAFHSEPDWQKVESVLGTLCPPPAALSGEPASVPVQIVTREGAVHSRLAHFLPLPGDVLPGEKDPARILGILLPVPAPIRFGAPDGALQLHSDLAAVKSQLRRKFDFTDWIAISPEMRRTTTQMHLARATDCLVLFTGERGTGKEHAARVIHYQGPHRLKTFVPVDCEALNPRDLAQILRRFFTVEEGDPYIPVVQPGTLFLRNVDRLPRDLQQFLAEQFVQGSRPDGRRLMVSTRLDLATIGEERLLPEFLSLVSTLTIAIPPLRSRLEELPLLAQSVLEEGNRVGEVQLSGFSADVLHGFRRYNWPGNVGELVEVVRAMRETASTPVLTANDLPFRFRTGMDAQRTSPPETPDIVPLDAYLERMEAEQIRAALTHARGNKSTAAELLHIPRAKLYRRMESLGIQDDGERGASAP